MNTKLILPAVLVVLLLALLGWFLFRSKKRPVIVPSEAQAGDLILKPCTVKLNGVKIRG